MESKYKSIAETILGFRNYEARALAAYRLAKWKEHDPFSNDIEQFTLYFSDQSVLVDDVRNSKIVLSNQKPSRRDHVNSF